MRKFLKNTIYLAVFLYAATNLPELQFSMAQAGDPPSSSNSPSNPSGSPSNPAGLASSSIQIESSAPTIYPSGVESLQPHENESAEVMALIETEGAIELSCNQSKTQHLSVMNTTYVHPKHPYSNCLEKLNEQINTLTPEDFFKCSDDSQICGKNCDCQAYIDENCNYAVGGQTPPTRCIYRRPAFPLLFIDQNGRGLDYIMVSRGSAPMIKCGFFVEAKGGCRCVSNVTTRTDSEKEPVILDQQ